MSWRRTKRKTYPCRHPDHKHYDYFMAELCRDLDDKILESEKDEKAIDKRNVTTGSKPRSNK
jgi:hypothetical protein